MTLLTDEKAMCAEVHGRRKSVGLTSGGAECSSIDLYLPLQTPDTQWQISFASIVLIYTTSVFSPTQLKVLIIRTTCRLGEGSCRPRRLSRS